MSSTRIYVGNLSDRIKTRDLEDIFYKYGRIKDVNVKIPDRGACYGFVEFEDSRDAEDAVRGRNGYKLDGYRIRCEYAKGGRAGGGFGGGGGGGGGRAPQKSEFRVKITGLPQQSSWQDIKDFIRKATDRIGFTDVIGDGVGVVEFPSRDDMEDVLDKLDDTEFRNRYGDKSFVRIKIDGGGSAKSRSRSRSSGRAKPATKASRSRSRSRGRDRDSAKAKKPSRSRSRSRDRARRRSPSRSRSASGDRRKDSREDTKARAASRSRSRSRSRSKSR